VTSRWARRCRIAAGGLLVAGALVLAAHEPVRRLAAPLPAPPEAVTAMPIPPAAAAPLAADEEDRPLAALPADAVDAAVSDEEFANLRRALVVPVAGIERSQLRDSYTEARGDRIHQAMDVLAPRGTPVLSAAEGTVLKLFDSTPGGLMIYAIDPSGRFILLYGHLDRYADGLVDGMPLARGQVIGYVGTTGNAAVGTPHLHFEILRANAAVEWWHGVPLNPYTLLVP
jgi:peptidoglycan LD-endopeptidase LytH